MKVRTDTEVAVLSARTDLDLAISTWLPGYVAQRADDLETAVDIARRGGVVLIDLGSPRHEEWIAALRDRGVDAPTVFLDPQGDVTIDLRDRVVVSSPLSLSGLLAGFEEAQVARRGPRRRRDSKAGEWTPARGHRRVPVESAGPPQTDRPSAAEESEASEQSAAVAGRARRLDRRQETEKPRVPRPRRSDRQRAATTAASWGPRRRRSSAAGSPDGEPDTHGSGVSARTGTEVGTLGLPAPARIDAETEGAFQAAFRAAETQPGVQRRIATSEGRVRVQTDEELFAGQPASTPAADECGTVVTPALSRERRARTGE
jgi:hypothetical protein